MPVSKARRKPVKPGAGNTAKPAAARPRIQVTADSFPGMKTVLHVGCGHPGPKLPPMFYEPGWKEIRLDIEPSVKPDILSDMKAMPMIADQSVDALYSSHNLEHLFIHEVPAALKEFLRVLKVGGVLYLTLPDLQSVAAHVAHGQLETTLYTAPAGPISALDVMYGFGKAIARGEIFMAHKCGFTAETLGIKLRDAGFSDIQVRRDDPNFALWVTAINYPFGHPKRAEKIAIIDSYQDRKMPPPPKLQSIPHPGTIAPGLKTDELDVPPKIWTPLGLKQS